MKINGKNIALSVVSILLIVVIVGVVIYTAFNWQRVRDLLKGTILYNAEQVQEMCDKAYVEGNKANEAQQKTIDDLRKLLEEQEVLHAGDLTKIADLTARVAELQGYVDSYSETIATQNTQLSELRANVEQLRNQLATELSDTYNQGYNAGLTSSVDLDALYKEAYDKGYADGAAQREKEYEQQHANENVVWDGTADTSWYEEGENSTYNQALDSYLIYNPMQLAGVAKLVNDGTTTFEGKSIMLMNNMVLNNVSFSGYDNFSQEQKSALRRWTPIGNNKVVEPGQIKCFLGNFYGNYYGIDGFYMYSDAENKFTNAFMNSSGFFGGIVGNNTSITISNLSITGLIDVVDNSTAGQISFIAPSIFYTRINFKNCRVDGSVYVSKNDASIGGYISSVGSDKDTYSDCTFELCQSDVDVYSVLTSERNYVTFGGYINTFPARADLSFDYCLSDCIIYGAVSSAAGFVRGINSNEFTSKFIRCYDNLSAENSASSAGFIGNIVCLQSAELSFINCYSLALSANSFISSVSSVSTQITFDHCYNNNSLNSCYIGTSYPSDVITTISCGTLANDDTISQAEGLNLTRVTDITTSSFKNNENLYTDATRWNSEYVWNLSYMFFRHDLFPLFRTEKLITQ